MSEDSVTLDQVLAARRDSGGPVVDVDQPMLKLVVFTLGDDWFAFRGDCIREILPDTPVFFLPGCPPSLEGVINVRGDIDSVLRLSTVLGLPDRPMSPATRILIGQTALMKTGLRVDSVREVLDVVEDTIQDPPHTIADNLKSVVLGIVTFKTQIVTILDLERLLQDFRSGLR